MFPKVDTPLGTLEIYSAASTLGAVVAVVIQWYAVLLTILGVCHIVWMRRSNSKSH